MDLKTASAVAGALVVSLTCLAAGAVVRLVSGQPKRDGRSWRRARSTRSAIRRNQFALADANHDLYDGWFRDTFRCSWASFNSIVHLVEDEWEACHPAIHHNARFFI